ncbi:MAG: fibrobacter succinogenes major paralogous domain-containing protein, partial [Prevotellaceae bacterium]|nr:fibrobacter succinogenes major paralogous domain-containing protein [Prevotellaceae bacterium]
LTRDTGLKLKLYVIYNDGNIDRAIELNISLQDCACCGAYVASGVWKVFMCHNLGADETKDPFKPSKEIFGAIYKFGLKDTIISQATNIDITGSIPWWTNSTPSGDKDWNMTDANPCPPGWRVPTKEEWDGVIANNTITRTANGGTSWSAGTATWSNGEEDNGIKYGDALVLPAAGYRLNSNGTLLNRGGTGYYWSSTANGTNGSNLLFNNGGESTYGIYPRSYGFSVRCLSE